MKLWFSGLVDLKPQDGCKEAKCQVLDVPSDYLAWKPFDFTLKASWN